MTSLNQNTIKHKTGLLNLAQELGNISKACKVMGFSRDTFYRYRDARDQGGLDALFDKSRRQPNLKNRVEEHIETAVLDFALDFPAYGQLRASNELRKKSIFVSPSGVRSIWLRHNLSSLKARLNALEKKSANDGLVLTEAQVQALERKKQDDLWLVERSKPLTLGIWAAGHFLCRHYQGCGQNLPANLCRHLLQGGRRQTLHHQNTHHRRRSSQ